MVLDAGNYSVLSIKFNFRRNVGYFIMQTYLPCMMIVVLSWVAFWINREAAPARISLGLQPANQRFPPINEERVDRYHNSADHDDIRHQLASTDPQSVLPECHGLVRARLLLLRLLRPCRVRRRQLLHQTQRSRKSTSSSKCMSILLKSLFFLLATVFRSKIVTLIQFCHFLLTKLFFLPTN